MHRIPAKPHSMRAPVPGHVVGKLQVAIIAEHESCRIAYSRKLAAEGNLGIAGIERIRGYSQQPVLRRERIACVRAGLSSYNREKPEARLIEQVGAKYMGPIGCAIQGVRTQVTAETRQ